MAPNRHLRGAALEAAAEGPARPGVNKSHQSREQPTRRNHPRPRTVRARPRLMGRCTASGFMVVSSTSLHKPATSPSLIVVLRCAPCGCASVASAWPPSGSPLASAVAQRSAQGPRVVFRTRTCRGGPAGTLSPCLDEEDEHDDGGSTQGLSAPGCDRERRVSRPCPALLSP